MSPPANGIKTTLAKGPIREALPKVAAKSGQSVAEIAALAPARIRAERIAPGHERGIHDSKRGEAERMAAQAPRLMSAPAESAAAGFQTSSPAAARVNTAEVETGLSSIRPAAAAASMTHALRLGGSAPAISA